MIVSLSIDVALLTWECCGRTVPSCWNDSGLKAARKEDLV